jgi:hypothetical protein
VTTHEKSPPESTGDAAPEGKARELLEHRDLQDAQIDSMTHVWDNPEDEVWDDIELPKAFAAQEGCHVNSSEPLTDSQLELYERMCEICEKCPVGPHCGAWPTTT